MLGGAVSHERSAWRTFRALKPVHGAEVREAVFRPQSAVPSEAIAVVGPGGHPRVAPSLVGDAGEPRQQQEALSAQIAASTPPTCAARPGPSASVGSHSNDSATVLGE